MHTAKIIAPVCSAQDAESLIASGADELYCGPLFDDWVMRFGDTDLLSRRQSLDANVQSLGVLRDIVQIATVAHRPVSLTLNAHYSAGQEPYVMSLATEWEQMGGSAIIVSDLGLLIALEKNGCRINRHLSSLAVVFNSVSAAFFHRLGISRLILPRELNLEEIRSLVSESPALEYEGIVMHQKCQFIDSLCGFYHGVYFPPSEIPASFVYQSVPGESIPVAWTCDPAYEGHGCRLHMRHRLGPVHHEQTNDSFTPHCAACQLSKLLSAGVAHFKIAGRGYPLAMLTKAVRFLRSAMEIHALDLPPQATCARVMHLYEDTYGHACWKRYCYYANSLGDGAPNEEN